MKITNVIAAGIAGTAVMTAYSYYITHKLKKETREPVVLGTLLTNEINILGDVSESSKSLIVGNIGHYAVGAAFAISYEMLWQKKIGKPDLKNGIILGLISGLIAVAGWSTLFNIKKRPQKVKLIPFLTQLVPAHVVFATSTVRVYNLLKKTNI